MQSEKETSKSDNILIYSEFSIDEFKSGKAGRIQILKIWKEKTT